MRRIAPIIASALLSGCFAATVIDSNPRTVAIDALEWQVKEAMQAGQKECQKHGRHAKLNAKPTKANEPWVFDCVQ